MSIKGQGHSFTLVKVHSDFKVKCLTFGLYTQVSDSGPLGPLVYPLVLSFLGYSLFLDRGILYRNKPVNKIYKEPHELGSLYWHTGFN